LLTGALGAGKTTLLNRLLADPAWSNTAVVINEVGAVAVTGAPVENANDDIVSLSGGCVCCTARGELVEALERLLRGFDNGRLERLDRVVVETTGSADPTAIVSLIARHPYLSLRFRLDGIAAVVDAANADSLAGDEQRIKVALADRVIWRRADGAADCVVRDAIRTLNPAAVILDISDSQVARTLTGIFDPPESSAGILAWLGHEAFSARPQVAGAGLRAWALARHDGMSKNRLLGFLDRLAIDHGANIIHFKGIVADPESSHQPHLVHGIGGLFSPPRALAAWPSDDRRTRFAMIGRDLDLRAVERLIDGFIGNPALDTPDLDALVANPLAIPGFRAR